MHYFKRNIGDYHKKAGRFTMLEHGACTLLVDACYDRERFPTDDEAIAWAWARTEQEKEAVRFVLAHVFVKIGDFWVHEQIKADIEKYHANAEKNKEIAIKREKARRDLARTVHDSCTNRHLTNNQEPFNQEPFNQEPFNQEPFNQEPQTINEEPKTKNQKPKKNKEKKIDLPECIRPSAWDEWLAYRKNRKLTCTEQTMNAQLRNLEHWHNQGHDPNAIISKSIENGWQGLFEPKKINQVTNPIGGAEENKRIAEKLLSGGGLDRYNIKFKMDENHG